MKIVSKIKMSFLYNTYSIKSLNSTSKMEKDVNDITQKHEQHSHNTGKQQKYQNKTVKQWTKTNIGKKKENNGWDGDTPTRGVPGVWWGS